ncbi:hypothetical protein CO731_01486 [Aminobacter sp. MSH1]|uniref:hypothetical protein n=1 Tax=Aminobacter sp. MSH1 TaxID=374606 RepID=UPI000D37C867|nr:hypothetical protein [Aminobacter sp. MSH1]AWC22030.1 hypothetical protein CO731_01486 [Aminobacter sp. MSH1]
MTRQMLVWAGLGFGALIIYWAKDLFGVGDQTFTLAIVAFGLIVAYHSLAYRLSLVEGRLTPQNSGMVAAIEDGERHVPVHQLPASICEKGVRSFITPAHHILFDDFKWFGVMLNRHIADPWAVEELRDTEIRDYVSDGPEYGRRYRVFYNACEMGTLQVSIGGIGWITSPEKFEEEREARALLELDYLRFVPHDDAHSLVAAVELFIGKFSDGEVAREHASLRASRSLTAHLWESIRKPEVAQSFEYRASGPYDLVRHTSQHWLKNGIDPFERWKGDR